MPGHTNTRVRRAVRSTRHLNLQPQTPLSAACTVYVVISRVSILGRNMPRARRRAPTRNKRTRAGSARASHVRVLHTDPQIGGRVYCFRPCLCCRAKHPRTTSWASRGTRARAVRVCCRAGCRLEALRWDSRAVGGGPALGSVMIAPT